MAAILIKIFILLITIVPLIVYGQSGFMIGVSNAADSSWTVYKQNTITNIHGNRWEPFEVRVDSIWFRHPVIRFDSLRTHVDNSVPSTMLNIDGSGMLRATNMSAVVMNQSNITHMQDSFNSRLRTSAMTSALLISTLGFTPLSAEADPVWATASANYFTKTASDGRYLQGYSETDPTVSSTVKAISGTDVSNWNTAFGWGNHGAVGYLKGPDTLFLWKRINGKYDSPTGSTSQFLRGDGTVATFPTNISSFVNDANYITSITGSQVTTALGYTPVQTESDPTFNTKFASKTTDDLAEGITLYFTTPRSRAAISMTNTGSSGSASYNNATGVLNVPTYSLSGLGGISLASISATAPLSYNNSTGVIGSQTASGSQSGVISSTDWNTFNGKQPALSGTGFIKISGTTISYDNSTYLTTEVDGSVTNEIELPSQTGNTGKLLTTNGTSVSWVSSTVQDYVNTVTTVADSAVFWITSDKTSTGTALYSSVNYVNPLINNVGVNYAFGWTISTDLKKVVVRGKGATPTGVISLLGISLLGAPVNVTTGTTIQILVKGN